MSDFRLSRRFALVMIPFNAFMHNMTANAQIRCLQLCREHLLPGDLLAFDTFFPGKEIITAPDGTRVLEGECTHADTGLPVLLYDTRSFDQHAGLWMRVDGPDNRVLSFDNMQNRAVKGSTDWKRYEIVLEVPNEATLICFGFLLSGKGTLWGDDLKIEPADEPGKGTNAKPESDADGKLADVTGQITGADDKPLAAADVLVVIKTWPNNRYMQRSFAAKTDKEGRFRFAELYPPDQRYAVQVAVVAAGHALEGVYTVNQQGGKFEPVMLRLGKAVPLELKFRDAVGKPVKGVTVYPAMRTTRDGKQHLVYHPGSDPIWKESDSDGVVSMSYFLKGDKVRVSFRLPGQDWGPKRNKEFVVEKEEEVIVVDGSGGTGKKESSPLDAPLSDEDATRVKWLADHAIRLRSIRPDDEDFSDLESFKQVIGHARIVQLGEQSHGDGATFHAKIRLIKFLHQKMGFDVLAFESGLYGCRKAWERLHAGDELVEAARRGIFGIWMQSDLVRLMAEYLGRAAKTDRPLELCGFDCQFTASASGEFLLADLKSFLDAAESPVISDETWPSVRKTIAGLLDYQHKPTAEERESGVKALDELRDRVITLGFTAYDGQAGRPWDAPRDIGEAPSGSLEFLLARAGLENAVVHFRDLGDSDAWLRSKLLARPLGYAPMRADWTQVLDGMVFNRTMVPSTRRL